jgi:hypothetical protein
MKKIITIVASFFSIAVYPSLLGEKTIEDAFNYLTSEETELPNFCYLEPLSHETANIFDKNIESFKNRHLVLDINYNPNLANMKGEFANITFTLNTFDTDERLIIDNLALLNRNSKVSVSNEYWSGSDSFESKVKIILGSRILEPHQYPKSLADSKSISQIETQETLNFTVSGNSLKEIRLSQRLIFFRGNSFTQSTEPQTTRSFSVFTCHYSKSPLYHAFLRHSRLKTYQDFVENLNRDATIYISACGRSRVVKTPIREDIPSDKIFYKDQYSGQLIFKLPNDENPISIPQDASLKKNHNGYELKFRKAKSSYEIDIKKDYIGYSTRKGKSTKKMECVIE